MKYLLDTDTCIYWLNNHNIVRTKLLQVGWSQVSISTITVAELYFGAYNSKKIEKNLEIVDNFVQSVRNFSLNLESIKIFGRLKATLRQQGLPLADFDLLIASIALANQLTVVTNNTRHYQRIPNLELDNWFN
ncbi:MAG: type II toxin-antitoxin system VapC family toxin [Crocosphaera sp.]|nr:type II toxin-antitoxin system VapC family toxin [Crocosphaera sp.]